MRKVFVFTFLCLVLLLLVPGIVVADAVADDSNSAVKNRETVVEYVLAQSYVLLVPAGITVTSNAITHMDIVVSDAIIGENERINVTISSTQYQNDPNGHGHWRLMNGNSHIQYHIHNENDEAVLNGTSVLSADLNAFTQAHPDYKVEKTLNLTVTSVVPNGISSGKYTDHLLFTSKIERI